MRCRNILFSGAVAIVLSEQQGDLNAGDLGDALKNTCPSICTQPRDDYCYYQESSPPHPGTSKGWANSRNNKMPVGGTQHLQDLASVVGGRIIIFHCTYHNLIAAY